jgi:hypothetical protein
VADPVEAVEETLEGDVLDAQAVIESATAAVTIPAGSRRTLTFSLGRSAGSGLVQLDVHLRGCLSNLPKDLSDLLHIRERSSDRGTMPVPPASEVQVLRQPNRKLASKEIPDLVARYRAGETITALGARFGIHESTARRHLRRAGIELRGNQRHV